MMESDSNYVGAFFDAARDKVLVWERISADERIQREWPAQRYFFVPDEHGKYKSIFGYNLKRLDFNSEQELRAACQQYSNKHESDIPPLFRCLMDRYYDRQTPILNYALIDIEVDYTSRIGFAGPANPYAPINAVTIYQSWTGKYLTYVVPPSRNGKWQGTEADIHAFMQQLIAKGDLRKVSLPTIELVSHETELLKKLVESIQNSDIISGWNSEFFDLPYIVRRLEQCLPKLVSKLCFIGCPRPQQREVERFGGKEIVYRLHGRTHLDYKDLYEKFTFEGRESYALGFILQEELGLSKLQYEGTIEELYLNDFPRFVAYNFRDVDGLVQLDEKFKFVQLVNQMAHENTCLFENILGTVRYVETGIANRAWYVHGMRVPDKRIIEQGKKVEGALVLNPKVGLHEWLGSVDINSLYPSVIRALNISPEMFRGQFLNGEDDWRGIMNGDEAEHVMRDDSGETFSATGAEWKALLREQQWAISAYGTVFDQSQGPGIVADTLTFWFAERKRLQAEKKKWGKEVKRLESLKIVVDDA